MGLNSDQLELGFKLHVFVSENRLSLEIVLINKSTVANFCNPILTYKVNVDMTFIFHHLEEEEEAGCFAIIVLWRCFTPRRDYMTSHMINVC